MIRDSFYSELQSYMHNHHLFPTEPSLNVSIAHGDAEGYVVSKKWQR